MSICALKSFLSKCLLPIYSFCLLLIVFSFLCFSIASSRCLCYLFKRTASPFRCTFLSCLLLISFQHKLAFPFFLFSKFFIYFSSFCAARPINNTYTTLALLMQWKFLFLFRRNSFSFLCPPRFLFISVFVFIFVFTSPSSLLLSFLSCFSSALSIIFLLLCQ